MISMCKSHDCNACEMCHSCGQPAAFNLTQLEREAAVSKVESRLRDREVEVESLQQQLGRAGAHMCDSGDVRPALHASHVEAVQCPSVFPSQMLRYCHRPLLLLVTGP
jgi:hypothetical protein